jgi:hypothetical protein
MCANKRHSTHLQCDDMARVLILIRWIAILFLGFVALMKEEQEGRWENRLEAWLHRVSSHAKTSYAKVSALMRAVSDQAEKITEKLFGHRLFSLRAFGVSLCYGIASLFLTVLLSPLIPHRPNALQLKLPTSPVQPAFPLFNVVTFGYFFMLGSLPAFIRRSEDEPLWMWRIGVFGTFLLLCSRVADAVDVLWGRYAEFRFVLFICVLFGLNFLLDVTFVKTTRWALGLASNTRQVLSWIVATLFNVLLGIGVLVSPILLGVFLVNTFNSDKVGVGLMFGFGLKSLDFVIALLVLILLALIGIHGIIWFALERPVYACLRFKVIRDKKLIWIMMGVLFLLPHLGVLEVLKTLVGH